MNTGYFNQDLTGALPASLGDLGPALKQMSLRFNAITSLPTELGALTGLTALNLQSNAITALPTEIGALTGLSYVNLQNNAITAVPSELGALTSLFSLQLYSNQFSLTEVPSVFRTWGPSSICRLGNYLLPFAQPGNYQSFSCANVGAGTSCCTVDNCGDVGTCFQG